MTISFNHLVSSRLEKIENSPLFFFFKEKKEILSLSMCCAFNFTIIKWSIEFFFFFFWTLRADALRCRQASRPKKSTRSTIYPNPCISNAGITYHSQHFVSWPALRIITCSTPPSHHHLAFSVSWEVRSFDKEDEGVSSRLGKTYITSIGVSDKSMNLVNQLTSTR